MNVEIQIFQVPTFSHKLPKNKHKIPVERKKWLNSNFHEPISFFSRTRWNFSIFFQSNFCPKFQNFLSQEIFHSIMSHSDFFKLVAALCGFVFGTIVPGWFSLFAHQAFVDPHIYVYFSIHIYIYIYKSPRSRTVWVKCCTTINLFYNTWLLLFSCIRVNKNRKNKKLNNDKWNKLIRTLRDFGNNRFTQSPIKRVYSVNKNLVNLITQEGRVNIGILRNYWRISIVAIFHFAICTYRHTTHYFTLTNQI